eukprot:COSAG05_NODE_19745_length_288_cov_0.825397_2_plen_67_part_01
MTGLQCVCGDVFTASCEIDQPGSTIAWLLLLLSAIVHAMQWCATDLTAAHRAPRTSHARLAARAGSY